jgi:hypothetical protein
VGTVPVAGSHGVVGDPHAAGTNGDGPDPADGNGAAPRRRRRAASRPAGPPQSVTSD